MTTPSPPTPTRALVPLPAPAEPSDAAWQPILHLSSQVVLYNPTSHALAIQPRPQCPYCARPLPDDDRTEPHQARVPNYFHLLAAANESSSRPATPPPAVDASTSRVFPAEAMAEGYFAAFFREESKLGMGANGSVYLCQHVLDGNSLGKFAVKKIAVGQSHDYLLQILREVRLLERLHHPHIITYHHAWLESAQPSPFTPRVPTLHVLMQWAEAGSLDDFISARLGRAAPPPSSHKNADPTDSDAARTERIRAFRAIQRAPPAERQRLRREMESTFRTAATGSAPAWTAVHLLSAEEVRSLFGDITEGLAFLHARSILHLDLKPGNVLLTWDDGRLVPRAMLSDFGTSRDMLHASRPRSGNTGTLEYTAPETLPAPHTGALRSVDSKADMWALGMLLHKMLFFRLPYRAGGDGESEGEGLRMERLEKEVRAYTGFRATPAVVAACAARRLPRAVLVLLEGLLSVAPAARPACGRVVRAMQEGRLDPVGDPGRDTGTGAVVTVAGAAAIVHTDSEGTVRGAYDDGDGDRDGDVDEDIPREEGEWEGEAAWEREGEGQGEGDGEKRALLGLPAPEHERQWRWSAMAATMAGGGGRRAVVGRALRSCVLVVKVLTLPPELPIVLRAGLLALAVLDTLWEGVGAGVGVSVVLGLVHVLVCVVARGR